MTGKLPEKISQISISVKGDSMVIVPNGAGWENRVTCETREELEEVLSRVEEGASLLCSSSIDFPEEQTSEKWILDWCEHLKF